MKYFIAISCCTIAIGVSASNQLAQTGNGMPLKYISSCEIDLNNDGRTDVAMLVETIRGRELVALISVDTGYAAYLISRGKPEMYLSCHFGKTIIESGSETSVNGQRAYDTPGTYLELTQPEAASVAYFWNGNGFTMVWTSD